MYHPELYPEKAALNIVEPYLPLPVKKEVKPKVKLVFVKPLTTVNPDLNGALDALRIKKGASKNFIENDEVKEFFRNNGSLTPRIHSYI